MLWLSASLECTCVRYRDESVVNQCGQDFDAGAANNTGDVHAGFYCVDDSIVSTSLGTNPLLAIMTLAERFMSRATSEPDLTPVEKQVCSTRSDDDAMGVTCTIVRDVLLPT